MGRKSTEMEAMRRKMVLAVDRMSPEDLKAMVLRSLSYACLWEMDEMAKATSFKDFERMDWELDLTL